MKRRWRRLAILICLSIFILSLCNQLFVPAARFKTNKFVISPKDTTKVIAKRLKEHGFIRSYHLFLLLAKIKPKILYAGEYRIKENSNLIKIYNQLTTPGNVIGVWVTIPEGYTNKQIADRLQEALGLDSKRFLKAASAWEGFLFPDTYLFLKQSQPNDIIKKMYSRFKEVSEPFRRDIKNLKLSWRQLIILASLIECEAKIDRERPIISAVLINRLKKSMKLQCDATVQYALGIHKPRLTYYDTKIESPYNTYLHKGLPPGPICNPGLASIKAAAVPAPVDYLYYVAKPDGSHIFSKTYKEHLEAIKSVR